MKLLKTVLFILLLFLHFISCSNSVEPPKTKNYKDPFSMTWTVDTLEYPGSLQTLLSSIWASSPTDVYSCGHNEINRAQFWHFDSNKWENIDLFQYVERSSWDLQKIFGFGKNDFWIIGARDREIVGYNYKESLVLQYNGSWKDHQLKYKSWIIDIDGTSSTDLWACGRSGVVLFYNGFTWKADTIIIKKFPDSTDYVLSGITKKDNEIYIVARTYNPYIPRREQYYIRGTMNNWKIIDSTIITNENWDYEERWGDLGIFQTGNGIIYSYGSYGVWKLNINNNQWNQILKRNNFIRGLQGVAENYLLATSDFGLVFFYDGTQWEQITNLISNQDQLQFYDAWTNGEEIFLLGQTNTYPMKTLIFHGK